MAFRARKTFATGRTVVQEGKLYDTDFGIPDRFDVVTVPENSEETVKSPRGAKKAAAKKADAAETADA